MLDIGSGAGMDIVVSSVRADVSALNKMLGFRILSSAKEKGGGGQASVRQERHSENLRQLGSENSALTATCPKQIQAS
ncbi:hypothetical protein Taro_044203 [Colocasia esculenta]|uniref:Uncharacterized protein n=1 Tax=Colocasia esculenta TaxID=4460 RepID=A0A843X2Y4_COLES|nr:hypothetical protein [Colocasia esculenta]